MSYGSHVELELSADLYYKPYDSPDPELKAWRYNIVPKPKDREVFARINPDTDLELSEIQCLIRILEANHPRRTVRVESDGTLVSIVPDGSDVRISLAFITAMAEARASKPGDETTDHYLTVNTYTSKMTFTDLMDGIIRYIRLVRPDKAVWHDPETFEVLGHARHPDVTDGTTPTYAGASNYSDAKHPKVHILTDAEYAQLMAAQYDRGFSDGLDARRAEVVG